MTDPHPGLKHKSSNANWLRAAVLGVDDGLVSTSSIMMGVLAAGVDYRIILTTGIASLVAGAFSMAAGEYVSVSSQRDSERYDIDIEKKSLRENPEAELAELTEIYRERGLDEKLAHSVAQKLHDSDAVSAHARDELGITIGHQPNPWQAAIASAAAFSTGSIIPILAAVFSNAVGWHGLPIVIVTLVMLLISGYVGAMIGGGNRWWAALRVFIGGGAAMAVTFAIGGLVGVAL